MNIVQRDKFTRLPETQIQLEQVLRCYGIRDLLNTLQRAIATCAFAAADNFNTVQGKQWAAWACAIEALRDDRKMADPGRD